MAGFCQGGGVGLSLANWIVEGDPGADIWAMDVARYGAWANRPYTNAKVRENYSRRFRIRFPNEELEAARPLRTTPIYERLREENAVFGDYCTLEHALWFAPKGAPARRERHVPPLQRARARRPRNAARFARAAASSRSPTTASSRSPVPGAADWLRAAHDLPLPAVGRIALAPMLNERGRLIGDFTLCRLADEHFFVVGTYAAEVFYMRWFERQLPPAGVSVRPCAMEYLGLSVAGPKSRDVLQQLVGQRPLDRGVPVPVVRAHGRRHGPGARRPRFVHRRAGLRDLGHAGVPARPVRPAA